MHKKIYWNHKTLIAISEQQCKDLSLLLPYWGLTLNTDTNEIQRSLENNKVFIEGIDEPIFQNLKSALLHTGVMLSPTPMEAKTDLQISVNMNKNDTVSMILIFNNKKYHIKPLKVETSDVQKIIHKHIWLPFTSTHLVFHFHRSVTNYTAEWLSYIIIQYFLKSSFKSLSHISCEYHEYMVSNVLTIINYEFAKFYNDTKEHEIEEWPIVPPKLLHKQKLASSLLENENTVSKIDPFKKQDINSIKHPFDPFKFHNTSNQNSIIKPF